MGLFIFAMFVALVGIGLLIAAPLIIRLERNDPRDMARRAVRAIGVAVVLIAFGLYAWSGVKSVPSKNIGIPVVNGAVSSGYYNPGGHETWTPWMNLVDVDETIHTVTFEGCWGPYCSIPGEPRGNCLEVRIGGQQTACADVTVQYQVWKQAAGSLYNDYANQGNLMTTVQDNLVERSLRQSINNVLDSYNPITDTAALTSNKAGSSTYSSFEPQVFRQMQTDIGQQVDVRVVFMPLLHYDTQTQNKLNQIQSTYASDAIAQEQINVNSDTARAYQKLGTPTQNDLIQTCLGYMDDLIKAGQVPQIGMCNLFGNSPSVITSPTK